jgi:phosphatidylglycerol:prolipoprotein diacylglycerol transferase
MFPQILHLYGPVWIFSYGTMIALGVCIFFYGTLMHKGLKKLISNALFVRGVQISVFAGVIGGRALYVASYPHEFAGRWQEIFYPWIGGLTIIGGIVGGAIAGSLFLRYHRIRILPVLDIVAIFLPNGQAIGRLGCFAGGCCYGAPAPADAWWAVIFTNPAGNAPLNIPLHPAQLYVAAASLTIFLILFFIQKEALKRQGSLVGLFLILENSSRFLIDFWRGDRDPIIGQIANVAISQVQLYAAIGLVGSIIALVWFLTRDRH